MNTTLTTERPIVHSRRRLAGLIAGVAVATALLSGAVVGAGAGSDADPNSRIANFPPYLIAQAQQHLLDAAQQHRVDVANAELAAALGRTRANFQP